MTTPPNADRIEQVAFGFMASKVLFSAIEFGLFTELARGPLEIEEIQRRFGLHPRGARDFLDALVALGMLERQRNIYCNTPDTDCYLDRAKPTYIGSLFQMWDARVYRFAGSLSEGLKTGKPQNEIKAGEDLFAAIYENPEILRNFLSAMTGHSVPSALAIAKQFPWQNTRHSPTSVLRRDASLSKSLWRILISSAWVSICPPWVRFSRNMSLPLSFRSA